MPSHPMLLGARISLSLQVVKVEAHGGWVTCLAHTANGRSWSLVRLR